MNTRETITLDQILQELANLTDRSFDDGFVRYGVRAHTFAEYEGFNPIRLRNKFLKAYPDKADQRKCMLLAITMFLVRGNNLKKILAKISDEFYTAFNKYSGFFSSSGTKLTKDTVTLARFAAAFPDKTAMLANEIARSVVPELNTWPKIMTSTVWAAVSPLGVEQYEYQVADKVNLYYLVRFDQIINSNKHSNTSEIVRYFDAAKASPCLNTEQRLVICKKMLIKEQLIVFLTKPENKTYVTNIDQLAITGYRGISVEMWAKSLTPEDIKAARRALGLPEDPETSEGSSGSGYQGPPPPPPPAPSSDGGSGPGPQTRGRSRSKSSTRRTGASTTTITPVTGSSTGTQHHAAEFQEEEEMDSEASEEGPASKRPRQVDIQSAVSVASEGRSLRSRTTSSSSVRSS